MPSNILNRANHPEYLKMDVTYNPIQCDTNVCWLMKAEADGWLWGSEMSQVVKNCNYVTNYTGYCPKDDPVDESTRHSAKMPMLLFACAISLVLATMFA